MNTLNDPIKPLDLELVHSIRCNELWAAVIAHAFRDADCGSPVGEKVTHIVIRAHALSWLRGTTKDFALVCDAAGADPEYVRRIARSRYGSSLDENWTPIELSEARRLSGVGSKPQKETKK